MTTKRRAKKARKEPTIAELVAEHRRESALGDKFSEKENEAYERMDKALSPHKSIRWVKITGKEHKGHHPDLVGINTDYAYGDYVGLHYIQDAMQHALQKRDIDRLQRLTAMHRQSLELTEKREHSSWKRRAEQYEKQRDLHWDRATGLEKQLATQRSKTVADLAAKLDFYRTLEEPDKEWDDKTVTLSQSIIRDAERILVVLVKSDASRNSKLYFRNSKL